MQQNMLPKIFPTSKYFEISAGQLLQLSGGDYYDFLNQRMMSIGVCGDQPDMAQHQE